MHKLILRCMCGLDMHGLLWICFVFRPPCYGLVTRCFGGCITTIVIEAFLFNDMLFIRTTLRFFSIGTWTLNTAHAVPSSSCKWKLRTVPHFSHRVKANLPTQTSGFFPSELFPSVIKRFVFGFPLRHGLWTVNTLNANKKFPVRVYIYLDPHIRQEQYNFLLLLGRKLFMSFNQLHGDWVFLFLSIFFSE